MKYIVFFLYSFLFISCSSYKIYTEGEYLDNVYDKSLVNDNLNEKDYAIITDKAYNKLKTCLDKNQYYTFIPLDNFTDETIDNTMLAALMVGKFESNSINMVDQTSRVYSKEEFDRKDNYTQGKIVPNYSGYNHIIKGSFHTNKQLTSQNKIVYYLVNFSVIDLNTNLVKCSSNIEIKKMFKSKSM